MEIILHKIQNHMLSKPYINKNTYTTVPLARIDVGSIQFYKRPSGTNLAQTYQIYPEIGTDISRSSANTSPIRSDFGIVEGF